MLSKINRLLNAYEPANTILAYQLMQTTMNFSKRASLEHLIHYFFDHHIAKDKKKLTIDFGVSYCHISFELKEYEFGPGGADTYLFFRVKQGTETVLSGDFLLSYDSMAWGDIGYYHRQDFQAQLDLFLEEYSSTIIENYLI
jgi:hypothetical protein